LVVRSPSSPHAGTVTSAHLHAPCDCGEEGALKVIAARDQRAAEGELALERDGLACARVLKRRPPAPANKTAAAPTRREQATLSMMDSFQF